MPARSNAEWQRWGELDPLWGVSSWAGKARDDAGAWTDDEFYALGASDWRDFFAQWTQYGVVAGSCVEIGCGAARLTGHMATFFAHVHGVDVAAGMLAKAAPAVEDLPVTLHLSDGVTLPLDAGSVDAAFSTHVFQHFDSIADVRANWREIARVLRPGGTVLVHVPMHIWPGGLEPVERVYAIRRALGDARAALRRRRMERRAGPPIMRGRSYAWTIIDHDLRELGFVNVELRMFRVASNHGLHPVMLACLPERATEAS